MCFINRWLAPDPQSPTNGYRSGRAGSSKERSTRPHGDLGANPENKGCGDQVRAGVLGGFGSLFLEEARLELGQVRWADIRIPQNTFL